MEANKFLLVLSTKSANVLLMWFKFNRILTNLLYARISLRTILQDMDILDEKFPKNLDDTIKILNECRVITHDRAVNGFKTLV